MRFGATLEHWLVDHIPPQQNAGASAGAFWNLSGICYLPTKIVLFSV